MGTAGVTAQQRPSSRLSTAASCEQWAGAADALPQRPELRGQVTVQAPAAVIDSAQMAGCHGGSDGSYRISQDS
jgi:hypothetical protein